MFAVFLPCVWGASAGEQSPCPPPEPGLEIFVSQGTDAQKLVWSGSKWNETQSRLPTFLHEPWPQNIQGGHAPYEVEMEWKDGIRKSSRVLEYRGVRLIAPFATKPTSDGVMRAAAVEDQTDAFMPSRRLAIFHPTDFGASTFFTLDGVVASISWSPSGKYLAVIESTSHFSGILSAISGFFGHPIPRVTLKLAIFSQNGVEICHQTLKRDLVHGAAMVIWSK